MTPRKVMLVYFSEYSNQLRIAPVTSVTRLNKTPEGACAVEFKDAAEYVLDAAWLWDDGFGNLSLEEVEWEEQ